MSLTNNSSADHPPSIQRLIFWRLFKHLWFKINIDTQSTVTTQDWAAISLISSLILQKNLKSSCSEASSSRQRANFNVSCLDPTFLHDRSEKTPDFTATYSGTVETEAEGGMEALTAQLQLGLLSDILTKRWLPIATCL